MPLFQIMFPLFVQSKNNKFLTSIFSVEWKLHFVLTYVLIAHKLATGFF